MICMSLNEQVSIAAEKNAGGYIQDLLGDIHVYGGNIPISFVRLGGHKELPYLV